MKTKNGWFLATALLFSGCDLEQTQYENSPVMREPATVVDLVYMPKNHGSGASPTIGMNTDGDVHFGVAFSDVDIPEKYAVVFECKHGKFVIDNDQAKARELYQKLHRDQKVIVDYQEVYEVVRKGKEIISPRKLVKFHFIDAEPDLESTKR